MRSLINNRLDCKLLLMAVDLSTLMYDHNGVLIHETLNQYSSSTISVCFVQGEHVPLVDARVQTLFNLHSVYTT